MDDTEEIIEEVDETICNRAVVNVDGLVENVISCGDSYELPENLSNRILVPITPEMNMKIGDWYLEGEWVLPEDKEAWDEAHA